MNQSTLNGSNRQRGVAGERATPKNQIRVGTLLCSRRVARAGAAFAERAASAAHAARRSRWAPPCGASALTVPLQLTRAAGPNCQREAAGSGPRS